MTPARNVDSVVWPIAAARFHRRAPVPFVWRSPNDPYHGLPEKGETAMEDLTKAASEQMGQAADQAKEAASGAMEQAQEQVQEQAQEAAGSAMEQAQNAAGDALNKAKDLLGGS